MADEKLTYCVAKGSRVFEQNGSKWKVAYSSTPKTVCGRLVRVTSIKAGDIRNWMDMAIVRVRGHELGTHPRNLKLVGGEGFRSKRAIQADIDCLLKGGR